MRIGTIGSIWRHPAKSMGGDEVAAATLTAAGMVGDRVWAVRDETKGGIRGAKKLGGLMRLHARFVDEPTPDAPAGTVEIELADGSTVRSDDDAVHAALSDALGTAVTLWPVRPAEDLDHYRRGAPDSDDVMEEVRSIFGRLPEEPVPDFGPFLHVLEFESPPGTYIDAYPVHLLTDRSLASLQRRNPDSVVDVRRFRPNLVVALDDDVDAGADFPELDWIGRRLTIGDDDGVELEVVHPCPRCVMVTRPQGDGIPEDRSVLRTIVREVDQNLGVYANVVRAGQVSAGAEVGWSSP